MKATILLNHDENTREIEEEEKMRFLRNILEEMNIPISNFWETDSLLMIEQKIKLRKILVDFGIQIIDDLDGNMTMYVDNEKIAQWYKSTYKLKRDIKQLDPKKQLYLEMEINYWSLFDEQEN